MYNVTRYWNDLITLFNLGTLVKVISRESEVFGLFIVGLFTGALNFSFRVLYVAFVWKLVFGSGVDVTNFPCTKIKWIHIFSLELRRIYIRFLCN